MRNLQELLGRFSLARLKKFRSLLPYARKKYQDALALAAADRDRFELFLPPEFTWSYLYELEYRELMLLSLATFGILEKYIKAHKAGLDLNVFMMDDIIREANSEDDFEWNGGHEGKYSQADLVAVLHASQCSWRCLGIYSDFLNDLVKKIRNGEDEDDDAFFKAIKIDRTILTCPTFSARLARAEYFGEKKFMLRLHKAIKEKPHDALLIHQDLRNMLSFFQDMKVLDKLSMNESDFIFIKELKTYQDQGSDPARSLMRFIQRWKEQK